MRVGSRVFIAAVLTLCSIPAGNLFAQSATEPTVFIAAETGFQTSLAAAMLKKKVPLTVTTDKDKADYVLQAAPVDSKGESGAGKVARCLFLDCIGINGYSEVSVQLLKRDNSSVVWAYQVRKGNSGPLGVQSLSEAIAKHLKNDYVKKQK
ncbi:MAG TPA: hypothetical protein VGI45_32105 [Terracidiphilus sp.]|jgi:hypothetical protein